MYGNAANRPPPQRASEKTTTPLTRAETQMLRWRLLAVLAVGFFGGCASVPTQQETLRISPRPFLLQLAQSVQFGVSDNTQGSGTAQNAATIAWNAFNLTTDKAAEIGSNGTFSAAAPGLYRIQAKLGSRQGTVVVDVRDSTARSPTIANPARTSAPLAPLAPQPSTTGPGWQDNNLALPYQLANRRGHDPVTHYARNRTHHTPAAAFGTNYQLAIPLLNLAGRGLNLNLNLFYNSNLWVNTKGCRFNGRTCDVDQMVFDHDKGWPAAGWSLGFGKAVKMGSAGVAIEDPDGTLHPFEVDTTLAGIVAHTDDGSLIDYRFFLVPGLTAAQGNIRFGSAWYPNGTEVEYAASSGDAAYPTRITDANGNFIAISYKNNVGPQIDTIQDTLGRTVTFNYDSNNFLTSITAPAYQNAGLPRVLVKMHYHPLWGPPSTPNSINLQNIRLVNNPVGFSPVALIVDETASGIDAIYFPGTSTGYWFGDVDSYSPYGMIGKMSRRTGMTSTGSLYEQGVISPGVVLDEKDYNYPAIVNVKGAPITYTKMTEAWAGMTVPPVVTQYSADLLSGSGTPHRSDVTYPDGTVVEVLLINDPNSFDDNLEYSRTTYDASGATITSMSTTWGKGDDGSPRVKSVSVTDKLNQTRTRTYAYTGLHNQLGTESFLDYDGRTVLRSIGTGYLPDTDPSSGLVSGYITSHIFNLPSSVQIIGDQRIAATDFYTRTDYAYDQQFPLAVISPPAANHVNQPQFRGNLTTVSRYSNTNTLPPTGAISETYSYDDAGNIVFTSTACCEQTVFFFNKDTEYAYPMTVTQGAFASPTTQISTLLSYDFDSGLPISITDANGRATTMSYDPSSFRLRQTSLSTGATIVATYDDGAQSTEETVTEAGGNVASVQITTFNGLGLVARRALVSNSGVCNLSIQDTQYDQLGRVSFVSEPYASGAGAGAFTCNQQPVWNAIAYDALGRIIDRTGADGSETTASYDDGLRPSSSNGAPGQTVRTTDARGRERWSRSDALGQLAEVVEPNPSSTGKVSDGGNISTQYSYNMLGQLTHVVQGPDGQERFFRYDSIGRLTNQLLPEKSSTLSDAGVYIGPGGKWSDFFTYDGSSNVTSHTDARGIRAIYDFGTPLDPLNRLQSVSYDMSGFGDTANPVVSVNPTTFKYIPYGDVRRILEIDTPPANGQGWGEVEVYGYDTEGRLGSKMVSYTGLAPSLILEHGYDSLGRLKAITYPAEGGNGGSHRRLAVYSYGQGARVKDLTVDGVEFASQITYNPAGQLASLNSGPAGPAQIAEEYGYDVRNGLLSEQHLLRGSSHLLDQSYDYRKQGTSLITGQLTGTTLNSAPYRTYLYDALGRLTEADGQLGHHTWMESYGYDNYGNRTMVTSFGRSAGGSVIPLDGTAALAYDTKSNHIISPFQSPVYTYDAAGNETGALRSTGPVQYKYDAAGRLSSVVDRSTGNTLESFAYGADRHRLMRSSSSQSTTQIYSIWDGDREVGEYSPAGNALLVSGERIYLGSRLLATIASRLSGTLVYYHHPDRLGSRLITTDPYSTTIANVTLPFGTVISAESGAPPNPIFTSYDRSRVTGLDYAVNRTYDHEGRFSQVDPKGMGATNLLDPQSLNLYSYAGNDPVNALDPTGLDNGVPTCSATRTTDCSQVVSYDTPDGSGIDIFYIPGDSPNPSAPSNDVSWSPFASPGMAGFAGVVGAAKEFLKSKSSCANRGSNRGFSGGLSASGSLEGGVGVMSMGGTVSVGFGGFFDFSNPIAAGPAAGPGIFLSIGGFAQAGVGRNGYSGLAEPFASDADVPGGVAFGLYGGSSVSVWGSNAANFSQMNGVSDNANLNAGPVSGALAMGRGAGPNVVSLGSGPGGLFDASYYPVNTFAIDSESISCFIFGP
jgi:RHS repeat-associated protein